MRWSSFAGQLVIALIFTLLVAAVLAAAAWLLVTIVVRKLRRRPAPRRHRWFRRTILAAAAGAVLCIAYGYFIEPWWLQITTIRVPTAKLPAGHRPIRIVLVSDLHCESKPRLETDLPQIVADLQPDLIAFTGDGFNSPAGLTRFHWCMGQFAAIAPTFAVQGNWDRQTWADRFVTGTGAAELTGQAVTVKLPDAQLTLIGAAPARWPDVEAALSAAPPDAFKIVLFHYPDQIPAAARLGVDLYLAGHTHGGQVALPFYGAIVTLSTHGKRFESGLYRLDQTTAYVSRGIGMEGGFIPRVRFCARPELTLIELVPQSP